MDLKSMLLPEKVVTFEFPGCEGFMVDLAFLSKESNQQLWKKCQRQVIDSKSRKAREEFDDELFLELYTRAVIKGWKGLKLKYLKELVLADVPEDKEEDELNYSEDNALTLIQSSNIFDNWVGEVISDIANFTTNNSKKKSSVSKTMSKKPDQD